MGSDSSSRGVGLPEGWRSPRRGRASGGGGISNPRAILPRCHERAAGPHRPPWPQLPRSRAVAGPHVVAGAPTAPAAARRSQQRCPRGHFCGCWQAPAVALPSPGLPTQDATPRAVPQRQVAVPRCAPGTRVVLAAQLRQFLGSNRGWHRASRAHVDAWDRGVLLAPRTPHPSLPRSPEQGLPIPNSGSVKSVRALHRPGGYRAAGISLREKFLGKRDY